MLSELISEKESQLDLFQEKKNGLKKRKVIQTVNQVNRQFGEKVITFAAEGTEKKWKSASSRRQGDLMKKT